ncbi:MAG TPA: DUF4340 domain-containing protein [Acidobacteriota bacterium]|nr:DUF4340 domain-containing protein [Acidobacteriota bacterium]
MKFGRTLVLLGAFLVLLAAVLFFDALGKKRVAGKEKEGKLVDLAAADLVKMSLKAGDGVLTFERDAKGEWKITEPLETGADEAEVGGLAGGFSGLRIERVVATAPADLSAYGIPDKELSLWVKGKDKPVRILVGMENPLDKTLFAKRDDDPRVVLIASPLKTTLDKTLFDFRRKDVFTFEKTGVSAVKVRTGSVSWEASKKDGDWFLKSPVAALAEKGRVETLIDSLAGLRASEFVSEKRTDEDIRKSGLDKAEYEVVLSMPTANMDATIALHKDGDKVSAMSSLADKIVLVESAILADLDKKPDEYREKKVAVFDSWDADRVSVTAGGLSLAAAKEKVGDADQWLLESEDKAEADGSKVEMFIRKIEGLEAAEFIDAPKSLADYGLDKPRAEVKVRTRDYEGKVRESIVLVGTEDKDKKQVVVKNAALGYLFRVDASFLQDIPKDVNDWKAAPETRPGDAKKAP